MFSFIHKVANSSHNLDRIRKGPSGLLPLLPSKYQCSPFPAITLPKIHKQNLQSFKGENIKSISGTILGLVRQETYQEIAENKRVTHK